MKGDRKVVPLADLYEFSSGLSKARSEFGRGSPFLSFKDVFQNFFVPDELTERVNSTAQEQATCSVQRGDVFLTRTSETMDELGMSCVALKTFERATFNGFTKRLRPKSESVVPEYAGYFFRSPRFRQEVTAMSTLSTRASLNNEMLSRLTIDLPSVPEQTAIGYTLKQFDEKVELNRRMNETLEAIARSIFKSWFVDFDPVRAKIEGRQPAGMSAEIAQMFPDSFELSDAGEIPSGWKAADIYGIADVIYGAPFKSSLFNGERRGTPLIRIRDLAAHDPSVYTPEEHPKGYLVNPGDLIVGMDGEFRAHLWQGPSAWLNQRLCCFKPKPGVPGGFVRFSIEEPLRFFEGSKTGTTVIHLGKGDIDTFRIVVAPDQILTAFGSVVNPIESRIVSNAIESRILADIRDTLLPKLISGEIRVQNAA